MPNTLSIGQILEKLQALFLANGLCKNEEHFCTFWLNRKPNFSKKIKLKHSRVSMDPLLNLSFRLNMILDKLGEEGHDLEAEAFSVLVQIRTHLNKFIISRIEKSIVNS